VLAALGGAAVGTGAAAAETRPNCEAKDEPDEERQDVNDQTDHK